MTAAADAPPEQLPSEIRGLLLPMTDQRLLLPNAIVIEVVNYQAPEPLGGAPAWLKGYVTWRREKVPLVSPEQFIALPETAPGHRARIVICSTIGEDTPVSYFGMTAQAIPRLIRVTPDDLGPLEAGEELRGTLARVIVAGEPVAVLDVDALEQELSRALPS
jgi:chemosensory pili system protein ChpC